MTLVALMLRGFGAIGLLVITILVARSLSPQDAGIFFLGLSMIMVIVPIGLMGLPTSLMRLMSVASEAGKTQDLFGLNGLAVRWVGFGLGAAVIILWSSRALIANNLFSKPQLADVLAFMLPASLLFAFNVLRAQQLIALQKELIGLGILFIATPLLFVGGIYLSYPDSPGSMARVYFSSVLLLSIFVTGFWRSQSSSWAPGRFSASALWQITWPLWVAAIAGIVMRWGGQFISGIWLSGEEIAFIAVAERLAMLVAFVNLAITPIYSARFAQAHAENNAAALANVVWQGVAVSITIALPVFLAILFLPSLLLSLFGQQYVAARGFLQIFFLGYFAHALFGLAPAVLAMTGHEADVRNIAFVGSVLTIGALFIFVPSYGALSAVWAMTVSVLFLSLASSVMVYFHLGINVISPTEIAGVVKSSLKRKFARHKAQG
jgi:O-antigen/teichoic acid export membrane protein